MRSKRAIQFFKSQISFSCQNELHQRLKTHFLIERERRRRRKTAISLPPGVVREFLSDLCNHFAIKLFLLCSKQYGGLKQEFSYIFSVANFNANLLLLATLLNS